MSLARVVSALLLLPLFTVSQHLKANTHTKAVVGHPANHPYLAGATTTADTALGRLLATGNHHGAGSHPTAGGVGTTPSGTSRYYSVDFGLIHFVALDLNMYNSVDTCGEPCRQAQLSWLAKDLEAANENRAVVPWIVAMSHFPLYV
jgi:hypothetical protein